MRGQDAEVKDQFEGVLSRLDATERWAGLSRLEQERWLWWISRSGAPRWVRMYEAAHRLAGGKPPPGRGHAVVSRVRAMLQDLGLA